MTDPATSLVSHLQASPDVVPALKALLAAVQDTDHPRASISYAVFLEGDERLRLTTSLTYDADDDDAR